ncbi:hypothetical protein [Sedimentibacter sp. B4]|uniref:hypothetical protein n=1 Tax=Sedimentibacter sp. B4 TaxID=304766 RepID=UPI0002D76F1E|nr:hypothetical protein [Sedimentibacter sp. B4]
MNEKTITELIKDLSKSLGKKELFLLGLGVVAGKTTFEITKLLSNIYLDSNGIEDENSDV